MGLFKKIKKVAKVALPIAASAYGLYSLGGMGGLGGLAGAAGGLVGGDPEWGMIPPNGGGAGGMFSGLPNLKDAAPILGGAMGTLGQIYTNRSQIGLAQDQMDFQERMSSTAYQRAVQDMMQAGLNPMLAYSQGGASSPGGAMPTIGNATATGLSSASQILANQNVQETNKLIQAQTENEVAKKAETESAAVKNLASAGQLDSMRDKTRQDMTKFGEEYELLKNHLGIARNEYLSTESARQAWERSDRKLAFPAVQQMIDKAAELRAQARLLNLKVPEALQEYNYFNSDEGRKAMHFRHGPKGFFPAVQGTMRDWNYNIRGGYAQGNSAYNLQPQ